MSFLLSLTAVSLRLLPPPFLFPWASPVERRECVAIPAQSRLILMPLSHKSFCCFEDPAIPLARLLRCNGPHLGLHPKHQLGVFRGPLGGIKRFEVVK